MGEGRWGLPFEPLPTAKGARGRFQRPRAATTGWSPQELQSHSQKRNMFLDSATDFSEEALLHLQGKRVILVWYVLCSKTGSMGIKGLKGGGCQPSLAKLKQRRNSRWRAQPGQRHRGVKCRQQGQRGSQSRGQGLGMLWAPGASHTPQPVSKAFK